MPGTTLFFDLDGCLVDSRVAIARSFNDALAVLGLPHRAETELHRYIGPPLHAAFIELLGSEDRADEGVVAYRDVYRRRMLVDTLVVPGIADALRSLHTTARLMVVTSKPQLFAQPILESVGLSGFFQGVVGPSLEARHETKTHTLARAIQECGGHDALGTAWMIGDRHHDIDAGKRNAIGTVGVAWGIGDRTELTAASPDLIAESPQELPALLLGAGHSAAKRGEAGFTDR